jgi:hypothetical protein
MRLLFFELSSTTNDRKLGFKPNNVLFDLLQVRRFAAFIDAALQHAEGKRMRGTFSREQPEWG